MTKTTWRVECEERVTHEVTVTSRELGAWPDKAYASLTALRHSAVSAVSGVAQAPSSHGCPDCDEARPERPRARTNLHPHARGHHGTSP